MSDTSGLFNTQLENLTLRQLQAEALLDFTGGVVLDGLLGVNAVREACNVDFQRDGGFCRRRSLDSFGDELPAKPCHVTFFENREGLFTTPGAQPRVFVSLENGEVYSLFYEDDGTITTSGPFDVPMPEDGECYRMKQINGRMYFFNGEDCTVCYDNFMPTVLPWTTSADYIEPDPANNVLGAVPVDGFPKARYVEVHGGFAWAADVIDPTTGERNCNRVWRSYPLVADGPGEQAWGEGDWVDIDPGNDGDCIVAIVSCGEELYVLKTHSMYRIDGYNEENLQVVPICQDVGAANCDAVACCDCRLWLFDPRKGVYAYDSQNGLRKASTPIDTLWLDEEVNCEILWDKARLGCCDGKVFLSLPGDGSEDNDQTWVYDPSVGERGAWTKYDYGLCTAPYEVCPSKVGPAGKGNCLAATTRCNHLVEIKGDDGDDDFGCSQCPVDSVVYSRWLDGDNPWSDKTWCDIELLVDATTVSAEGTVEVLVDYQNRGDKGPVQFLPAGSSEEEFTLGTHALCTARMEQFVPGGEMVQSNCKCPDCVALKQDNPGKLKVCGPTTDALTGCVLSFCFRGPCETKWCVCGVLVKFYPEELRC